MSLHGDGDQLKDNSRHDDEEAGKEPEIEYAEENGEYDPRVVDASAIANIAGASGLVRALRVGCGNLARIKNLVRLENGAIVLTGAGTTIQFAIEPDGMIDAVEFPLDLKVRDLRRAIAQDLDESYHHIVLRFFGVVPNNDSTLEGCGLVAGRHVQGHIVIDRSQTSEEYRMPDVLVVAVRNDETGEPESEILVEIARADERKKYLGGFRHKLTGTVYHHAYTQTPVQRKSRWEGKAPKLSRETQTVQLVTRSTQAKREMGIQMERPGLHIDRSRDRVLAPKPYFSADELDALKARMVIIIQRNWRGFLARGRAHEIRKRRQEHEEARAREEEERAARDMERHRREVQRRLEPKTAQDFAALYGEVEAWRAAETMRIKEEIVDEEERAAANSELLTKETAMIQHIERLRIAASKQKRAEGIEKMLDSLACAKKWELGDGTVSEIETPFTTRAKELRDLYRGLADRPANQDDRVDVLMHVKWTVKEFDCPLTREISQLIDREVDILERERPARSLSGLRQRLENLFLEFIRTPEFNPEAERFQKVPREFAERAHKRAFRQ